MGKACVWPSPNRDPGSRVLRAGSLARSKPSRGKQPPVLRRVVAGETARPESRLEDSGIPTFLPQQERLILIFPSCLRLQTSTQPASLGRKRGKGQRRLALGEGRLALESWSWRSLDRVTLGKSLSPCFCLWGWCYRVLPQGLRGVNAHPRSQVPAGAGQALWMWEV